MLNDCQFHDITPIFWILCYRKCLKKSNLFTVIFSLFLGFFWCIACSYSTLNSYVEIKYSQKQGVIIYKNVWKNLIYWELKYPNLFLFFGPSCDLVFISEPILSRTECFTTIYWSPNYITLTSKNILMAYIPQKVCFMATKKSNFYNERWGGNNDEPHLKST